MSGKRLHHLLHTGMLLLILLALATPAAAAAKLIHMNNGKVMRVESVEADGEWLVVALDGGHSMGIRAELVAEVTDDLGDDNDFGEALNVVTSGRYVPKGRADGFSNRQGGRSSRSNALDPNKKPRASQPQPGGTAAPAIPATGAVVIPPGQRPGPSVQSNTGTQPRQGLSAAASRRQIRSNRPNNN
jgi:hypothetical protein